MGKNRSISCNVGAWIKHKREKLGMSLKDLENMTGVSATYICRLEKNDRKNPSYSILEVLAEALGIDMTELMEVTSDKEDSDVKSLTTLLLTSDFTISNDIIEKNAKELLVDLFEKILNVEWNSQTKLRDTFEIAKKIDDLKAILD